MFHHRSKFDPSSFMGIVGKLLNRVEVEKLMFVANIVEATEKDRKRSILNCAMIS